MFEQTDQQLWALLVGTFLPIVIAMIVQRRWSTRIKQLAAFALCVIAGAGTAYYAGAFEARSILGSVMLVLLMAHTTYHTFWRPTGVAPAIEEATSPDG